MSFVLKLRFALPTRRLRFSMNPFVSSATTLSTAHGVANTNTTSTDIHSTRSVLRALRATDSTGNACATRVPSRPPTAMKRLLGDVESALSGPLKSMDARTPRAEDCSMALTLASIDRRQEKKAALVFARFYYSAVFNESE